MAGKNTGVAQLEQRIGTIKFTILCLNAILWILGLGLFGLSIWMRVDSGFQEWVEFLDMYEFYIGVYILIIVSVIIMLIAFVGCGVALMEHILGLFAYTGIQMFVFLLGLIGAGLLLNYSTVDSSIQPIIRNSMTTLITNSQHQKATQVLRLLQENIGCCGADGPMDYLDLLKPLPNECRDTVTGNAFFHGCVDEITWYLEGRSGWIAGITLGSCMLNVILAVLSLILVRALQKEEESVTFKR